MNTAKAWKWIKVGIYIKLGFFVVDFAGGFVIGFTQVLFNGLSR